jgi:hypothetical protein
MKIRYAKPHPLHKSVYVRSGKTFPLGEWVEASEETVQAILKKWNGTETYFETQPEYRPVPRDKTKSSRKKRKSE